MHAVAALAAAAATWSAPQTVSSPHTFVGPLYASSSLVAWNWQDGVGQTTGAGASQASIAAAGVSPQRPAPTGLVAAQPYDGGSVLLANRQLNSRGTHWRLTVTDGSRRSTLASGFILLRPQLSVAPDGSAIASWVELRRRRQIVRASTRVRTGRFSRPFTLSGRGQTTVLADAANVDGGFLAAYVRNGKLLARVHHAHGHWGPAHLLQRAQGRTHWQLVAAPSQFDGMQLAWIRHRFRTPARPGARELFAAGMQGTESVRPHWTTVQRVERDGVVGPTLTKGGLPMLAYAFGPNSHAVARVRPHLGDAHFGAPIDASAPQGGLRSVSLAFDPQAGLVVGWVIPNPSGDGGGIGYAAATGSGNSFGPREQVTPNEATFEMQLVRDAGGVRAFWTARPEGTGPSIPISQVHTVVRTAARLSASSRSAP